MKICLNCGEPIMLATSLSRFCYRECALQFHRFKEPRTIANSFLVFQRIVNNSKDFPEFKKLWNQYFKVRV